MLTVVPEDIEEFCPAYSRLARQKQVAFWVYLLSSITQFESNFKPETSYQENFRDANGNYVISRGLLQLSIESGNGYGCAFRSASDVHDPLQNLSCGIRILNRWVSRDKQIAGKSGSAWQGGARYWSVLRTADRVASIKSFTTGYCKNL
jgi:hypothetical protein